MSTANGAAANGAAPPAANEALAASSAAANSPMKSTKDGLKAPPTPSGSLWKLALERAHEEVGAEFAVTNRRSQQYREALANRRQKIFDHAKENGGMLPAKKVAQESSSGKGKQMKDEDQAAFDGVDDTDELVRMAMQTLLPEFDISLEDQKHTDIHMQPCDKGIKKCVELRGKGCMKCHRDRQFRRPAIEPFTRPDGTRSMKLTYFDILCNFGTDCTVGVTCPFAHSKIEVLVHPARYKTRKCDSFKCFNDNCSFVHDTEKNRGDFAERYSFSFIVGNAVGHKLDATGSDVRGQTTTALDASDDTDVSVLMQTLAPEFDASLENEILPPMLYYPEDSAPDPGPESTGTRTPCQKPAEKPLRPPGSSTKRRGAKKVSTNAVRLKEFHALKSYAVSLGISVKQLKLVLARYRSVAEEMAKTSTTVRQERSGRSIRGVSAGPLHRAERVAEEGSVTTLHRATSESDLRERVLKLELQLTEVELLRRADAQELHAFIKKRHQKKAERSKQNAAETVPRSSSVPARRPSEKAAPSPKTFADLVIETRSALDAN